MLFTSEELHNKKYTELLKILKKLGIKTGRLKTEKVIELIIQHQKESEKNEFQKNEKDERNNLFTLSNTEAYQCGNANADQCSVDSVGSPAPIKSPSVPQKRMTRSGTFTISDSEENDKSPVPQKRMTRSGTFTISDSEENDKSPVPQKRMTRSGTFTVSDCEGSDKSETPSLLDSSDILDLSCGEMQTAEDIQWLMEASQSPAPTPQSMKSRRIMRRSLRGQLLEAKALMVHRHMSPQRRSQAPLTHPQIEKVDDTKELPLEQETRSFKAAKMDTVAEKKSAIPRLLPSTRSKMPNFSRIHEKAFGKMEALDDYVQRKQSQIKSAKKKPMNSTHIDSSSPSLTSKTNKSGRTDVTPSGQKEPRRSRLSKPRVSVSSSSPFIFKGSTTSGPFGVVTSQHSLLPTLKKENIPPKRPSNTWNKSPAANSTLPGSLQRRKDYVVPFPRKDKTTSFIASRREKQPQNGAQLPQTFKGADRKERFRQQITKLPKLKSRTEMRASEKTFIKGVRTNRRFELQMAKRGVHL